MGSGVAGFTTTSIRTVASKSMIAMLVHRLLAILVATVLVAGCAGGEDQDTPEPEPSSTVSAGDGNETTTPDQGAIEGVVKDDELQPISGVTVAIRELSVKAESDESGAFAFTDVPVGDYVVDAAKLGFAAAAEKVSVVAGETAKLEFGLVTIVLIDSYNQTTIHTGRITCGAIAVPYCGATQDVGAPSPSNDQYAFSWPYAEPLPAYEIFEMVWTPTVPGSAEKLAMLYLTSPPLEDLDLISSHTIFSVETTSPARGEAKQSQLQAAHEAYPSSDFALGVYPAFDGYVLDQPFTIYKTTFYGEEPPEGWTYLTQVDG